MTLTQMSEFDWYAATLPEQARMTAVDVLLPLSDEAPRRIRGMNGYARGWELRQGGSMVARCFEGPGKRDHVIGSGSDAVQVARVLRRHVPGHTCSRVDVKMDRSGGRDFFDSAHQLVHVALTGRVKLRDVIETGPEGSASTLYVGSRSSETFVRMYEKGKQDSSYAPDVIRLEAEVKPSNAARKLMVASMEPDDLWGLAKWSRWIVEQVVGGSVAAAPPRSARVSDLERSLAAAGSQYGERYWELLEHVQGDLEAFALYMLGTTKRWQREQE